MLFDFHWVLEIVTVNNILATSNLSPRLEIKHISLYNNTHIENTFRKMPMLPYPFSYFSSIWGFRKPLSKRFGLNWFQLLFTSIFLISLSMVPIAIQNSSQETYPLDTFIDNVYTPLTDEAIMDLSENTQIVDGKLNYSGTKNHQPSLLIGPS